MPGMESIVFVIDDDPSFRRSTQLLLETAGFNVSGFASGEEFLRSRRDYGVVYAGTELSAIFRSEDGGNVWRELKTFAQLPSAPTWSFPPRPETSHVRWITPDPLVSGRIFVAIEARALVHSADGGEHWEDRRPDTPYDTHTLVMHSKAPNRLYSGGWRRL